MNDVPQNKRIDISVPPAAASGAMPWNLLSVLLAYSFLSWFNRVSMSVAGAEQIIKTPNNQSGILSETEMGTVYSALLFAYTIFMTPGGWLADRAGPRTALILMGFGSALFVAMTGWVGVLLVSSVGLYYGLLAARGLMGVFTAPIYPAACRVVSLEVPAHRHAAANGWIMGAALLGIAAAPFVFGFLIDSFGWPNAFAIMGGVTAAAAIAWVFVTAGGRFGHHSHYLQKLLAMSGEAEPAHSGTSEEVETNIKVGQRSTEVMQESVPAKQSVTERLPRHIGTEPQSVELAHPTPWWHLLIDKNLILLTIGYAAVGYYEYLFYFWSQYYFNDVMNLGKDISRLYATLTSVAMAGGMFAGGWLTDQFSGLFGPRRARVLVPAAGLLGGAVFLGMGLYWGEYLGVATMVPVFLALANASVGVCEGPLWATAVDVGGRNGATAAGIFNTGGNLGGMFAPAATPLLAERFGWPAAIGAGIGACLLAVVFLALVNPGERAADKRR